MDAFRLLLVYFSQKSAIDGNQTALLDLKARPNLTTYRVGAFSIGPIGLTNGSRPGLIPLPFYDRKKTVFVPVIIYVPFHLFILNK